MKTEVTSKYATSDQLTPGPWYLDPTWGPSEEFPNWAAIKIGVSAVSGHIGAANARLIVAAPDLLNEARVLRCLATSPRYQQMTVADALREMKENGIGHDDGASIAKAGQDGPQT